MHERECVLAIAPHPNDETLGCGGRLLRHRPRGDAIHWAIITRAMTEYGFTADVAKEQDAQVTKVRACYGFTSCRRMDYPPARLDTVDRAKLIGDICDYVREIQPTTLYLPFAHDAHSDHYHVFMAAMGCSKVFRYPSIRRVCCMEIPSETDFAPAHVQNAFTPTTFVDISMYIETKLEILKIYKNQIQPPPFPRSLEAVKALAAVRGSAAGMLHAEAFMLVKEIIT